MVKKQFAELKFIAGPQIGSPSHVCLAVRHQVEVIPTELQGTRKVFLEEIRKPRTYGGGNDAADQIQIAGTIDRVLAARISEYRKVEHVLVPVTMVWIALHPVFIAWGIVVVVV